MIGMENNFHNIPKELKEQPNWVNWISPKRNGKSTKIPVNPKTGGFAKSNDPSTWATFDEASSRYESDHVAGVGFVFTSSPFCGIDLDHCRDSETGVIKAWAKKIMRNVKTYAEVSPSGTGVHLICKGELPPGGRNSGRVEMYDTGRYFTVTGQHVEGTPLLISDAQKEIENLHKCIFTEEEVTP